MRAQSSPSPPTFRVNTMVRSIKQDSIFWSLRQTFQKLSNILHPSRQNWTTKVWFFFCKWKIIDENIWANYFSPLTFSWSVSMENYCLLLILFLHNWYQNYMGIDYLLEIRIHTFFDLGNMLLYLILHQCLQLHHHQGQQDFGILLLHLALHILVSSLARQFPFNVLKIDIKSVSMPMIGHLCHPILNFDHRQLLNLIKNTWFIETSKFLHFFNGFTDSFLINQVRFSIRFRWQITIFCQKTDWYCH